MLLWIILKVALKSLRANKLRSFLAMLGIVIGVGSVISMLALGAGVQRQNMLQWTAMGTNLLIIRPGARGMGGVNSGTQQNLTLEDAEALRAMPNVDLIAPVVGGNAQVKYMNKNSRVNLIGTGVTYFPIRNFVVEKGRAFTESEAEKLAHVAVIGPLTAENLFGTGDSVGETIKLNGVNFRVVGVLKSKGDQGWFNPDDQVILPYSTAMKQVLGIDRLREIDIQAAEGADIAALQEETTKLMRRRHRLLPGAPDDFNIRNQAEMLEQQMQSNKLFTILLGCIAGISLFVGGIGIMNIMLVTVTERTREIGVRKAIGARDRDILRQFLVEAILMSSVGGLTGVLAGLGGAELISVYSEFKTIVESWSIILSLSVAVGVGIFFGYYPARRAAALDPIVALRYE